MIAVIFTAVEIGNFMDWIRKHINELAGICKVFSEDPALSPTQRDVFLTAFAMAKPASSLPQVGDARLANQIVIAMCVACRNAFEHDCPGRSDWQNLCKLMRSTRSDGEKGGIGSFSREKPE